MAFSTHADDLIVGIGIHGLSAVWQQEQSRLPENLQISDAQNALLISDRGRALITGEVPGDARVLPEHFCFERSAKGEPHPVSNSHYP